MPEYVLRCPNADDSCTYPDCNHVFREEKEDPMPNFDFARSTKGDPIAVIKDVITKLTFDEMLRIAQGLGIDPAKINDWARGTQTFDPGQFLAKAKANDNVPTQS